MATKKILTPADLQYFNTHQLSKSLLSFIDALNSSVIGLPKSSAPQPSPIIQSLSSLINAQRKQITPPKFRRDRFGSEEFRTYYDTVVDCVPRMLTDMLPSYAQPFVPELTLYFCSSFGSRQRIDYGTGHETHFIIFLYALNRLKLFNEGDDGRSDYKNLVVTVYWEYLEWMRHLQVTYWLEPAGSHGVWGLDDYHFFPFLFGSSQLSHHKHLTPKSIHSEDILHMYAHEYLYLKSIAFINSVKSESLKWHSPMLNDISGVKSWQKINEGMRKMFIGEVLSKLPIMQHVLFGRLFGGVCGLIVLTDHEEREVRCVLGDDEEDEFRPPSGHSMGSNLVVHASGCTRDTSEEFVEVVVKYVVNSKGEKIPIYGHVPISVVNNNDTMNESDEGKVRVVVDTFAMGQTHPECCGIRIPSAIAAKGDLLPFD